MKRWIDGAADGQICRSKQALYANMKLEVTMTQSHIISSVQRKICIEIKAISDIPCAVTLSGLICRT